MTGQSILHCYRKPWIDNRIFRSAVRVAAAELRTGFWRILYDILVVLQELYADARPCQTQPEAGEASYSTAKGARSMAPASLLKNH